MTLPKQSVFFLFLLSTSIFSMGKKVGRFTPKHFSPKLSIPSQLQVGGSALVSSALMGSAYTLLAYKTGFAPHEWYNGFYPYGVADQWFYGTTGVLSSLSGLFGGRFAYKKIDEYRFKEAQDTLVQSCRHPILGLVDLAKERPTDDFFILLEKYMVNHASPRVEAFNTLCKVNSDVADAKEVFIDIIEKNKKVELVTGAKEHMQIIDPLEEDISLLMQYIKSDPDWLKRLEIYNLKELKKSVQKAIRASKDAKNSADLAVVLSSFAAATSASRH